MEPPLLLPPLLVFLWLLASVPEVAVVDGGLSKCVVDGAGNAGTDAPATAHATAAAAEASSPTVGELPDAGDRCT